MEKIKDLRVNLESKILSSETVVIVPHNGVDFDAIGSAIGLSAIVKKLRKQPIIVVDDPIYKIDHGVQLIIDEARGEVPIISKDKYLLSANDTDLYILTDVNKSDLVSLRDKLTDPDRVVVIDHHNSDDKSVKSSLEYIDPIASSASEIVVELLTLFKCKCSSETANYLLAGIYLDTNNLTKNVSSETMKAVTKLLELGGSINKVMDLFTEDFMSDRRVQDLVSRAKITTYSIATILADETDEYTKEELAKAADYLLKYKVDAAFSIGRIDEDTISVSARSKEKIDVGLAMQEMNGGGNQFSGATKIVGSTIEEVSKTLTKIMQPRCYINQE